MTPQSCSGSCAATPVHASPAVPAPLCIFSPSANLQHLLTQPHCELLLLFPNSLRKLREAEEISANSAPSPCTHLRHPPPHSGTTEECALLFSGQSPPVHSPVLSHHAPVILFVYTVSSPLLHDRLHSHLNIPQTQPYFCLCLLPPFSTEKSLKRVAQIIIQIIFLSILSTPS